MAGRAAYPARLPLLTPEARSLVVNGTTVERILQSGNAAMELRAALSSLSVAHAPAQIDTRISRLCTELGLASTAIWRADQTGGQAPAPAPVQAPSEAGGTPPVVPPRTESGPPGQASLDALEALRRLQPQSQDDVPSPPFSPLVPTPTQQTASASGSDRATPSSGMSGFTITPPSPAPVPEQADLAKRVDNMLSLFRSLEPELVELQKACRTPALQASGVPTPVAVLPTPSPSVRFVPPTPTRTLPEAEVVEVDMVPRKRRKTQSPTAAAAQAEDASDGDAVDAPSLDTPEGVASIDKVCFLPEVGRKCLVPPRAGASRDPCIPLLTAGVRGFPSRMRRCGFDTCDVIGKPSYEFL